MNGHEKSDPVAVAMKPANKAGRPVAERVERRVGTKGNAGQHDTRRAQNRESVTQALARVRQAPRTRKKERFTALLTTSMSICSAPRSSRSNARPRQGWMV